VNAEHSEAWPIEPELAGFNADVERAAAALPRPVTPRAYRRVLLAYDGTPDAQTALECVPAVVSAGQKSR